MRGISGLRATQGNSRGYYTADSEVKCVICGKAASTFAQLVRTDQGYKCGSTCRPVKRSEVADSGVGAKKRNGYLTGSWLVVLAMLSFAMVAGAFNPTHALAAGTPDISLDKSGDSRVLFGENSNYTLTASNPSGQPTGYNLSFRDVLPAGVSYVAGSAPAMVGEPQIINNAPSSGKTTLIWSNVGDLTPNSTFAFEFKAKHNPSILKVGDSYTNTAGAYINCDPRFEPDFSASGLPLLGGQDPNCSGSNPDHSYTGSATDSASTRIEAIELTKEEPSPEGELLRGVHNHQTVYTLNVKNNFINPSTALRVEDYLPAGLEFLGCGGVDNTTNAPTNPGSPQEYKGSGPVNPGNEPGGSWRDDCFQPDVTETVKDPAGLPAGVYTHVVWNGLPNLIPGAVYRLRYSAAIPIRENTMDWNGTGAGLGTAPGPGGAQIANLDNNSGPETIDEQALTNRAAAFASYQSAAGPIDVSDEAELTRTAEDLRILKSVDSSSLNADAISRWSLQIDTSEYRFVDDLVVTDTLGDGYCPLGGSNLETTPPAAKTECNPVAGQTPSAAYASAVEQPDGKWLIKWDPVSDPALARIQPSSTHTISFPTRTRKFFQENFNDATPLLARDSAGNDVSITGNDFIICAPGVPDACAPGSTDKINADETDGTPDLDVSSAGQSGNAPSIDKTVSGTVNGNCAAVNDYVDGPAPKARPGDTVCWRLNMTFPSNLNSGKVSVADFIPPGTSYVSGSTAATAANTTTIASAAPPQPDVSGPRLNWPLSSGSGTVDEAKVFEVTFATLVKRTPTSADADIIDNLMKSVFSNTAGTSFPLRDSAAFELSQPEVSLLKGVRSIDGQPAGGRGPNVDGGTVTGGDTVIYRVDLKNAGSIAAQNTQVWDVLPSQITCSDLDLISDSGTCDAAQNRIEWTGLALAAAGTKTLTYRVTVPDGLSGGSTLVNRAGVRQFESASGSGPYVNIPANNIDPVQTPNANAPAADDPSNVQIESAAVTKTRTTEIGEPGNALADQATIGEQIEYTVTTTIPAGTSLFGADTHLLDDLGTRQTLVPGSASAKLDAGNGNAVALPTAGLSLSTPSNTLRIDFPNPYSNPQGSGDDIITLVFSVKVDDDFPDNQAQGTSTQRNLPNSATLRWQSESGVARSGTGSTSTTIVEPAVAISKTSNATGLLTPGQVVRFTVTGSNGSAARNSTAHDAIVVDTLPDGLDPVNNGTAVADGGTVNPDGGIWNEAARTITWPSITLAPGASRAFTYDAKVTEDAIASGSLRNTAAIITTSLPDGADDDGERDSSTSAPGYQAGAELTGTLISGDITKTGNPAEATIGGEVTHTLTVSIPANLRQYDTTVIDDLPDGLLFGSYLSANCTSGCSGGGSDINPVNLNPVTIGDGQRIGWFFGDLQSTPVPRTVVLKYRTNIGSEYKGGGDVLDGQTLTNEAQLLFNLTDRVTSPPTDPPDPSGFDQKRETEADTGVVEPLLVLDKNVSGDVDQDDLRDTQPGDSYTYSVKVTNNGKSPAYDVSVSDQPDPDLTNVVVATSPNWTVSDDWTASDRSIGWFIPGPIGPGESVTLTYTADLVTSDLLSNDQEVDNTADVPDFYGLPASVRQDPANSNVDYRKYEDVEADSVKLIVRVPRLSLDKTTGASGFPDDAQAVIEQPFAWHIVITNVNDPSVLNAVDLDDVLPPNWTYESGSAQVTGTGNLTPGGSVEPAVTEDPDGDRLSWRALGDLDGGETIVVDFRATPKVKAAIDPGVGVAHLNEASAEGEDTSGARASAEGPYADSDTATGTLIAPDADLQIVKKATDPSPIAGTNEVWKLTVRNNGPQSAPAVAVSDVIPDGLTFVSAVADKGTCAVDQGTVFCNLGEMASGDTIEIVLTTKVGADQNGVTIENTARVADPSLIETDMGNNVSTDVIEPSGLADLALQKNLLTDLIVGQTATYELNISNSGPSTADEAVVTDELPANLEFKTARTPVGSCSAVQRVVTCSLGDLPPGALVSIQIDVDVLAGGQTTNSASVTSGTPDPDLDNNVDKRTDQSGNADLAIRKTGPGDLVAGKDRIYTLEVSNAGGIASAGPVTVTDRVPDALRPVAADGFGWSCGVEAQLVTCSRSDSLAPGVAFPLISIRVQAIEDRPGFIINGASVKLEGDPNPANDFDEVRTPRQSVANDECRAGSISILPGTIWVGQRTRVTVRVESSSGNAVAGVAVRLKGNGKGGATKRLLSSRTDKRGRAYFTVRAGQKSAAWTASARGCGLSMKLPARKQMTCRAMTVTPRSIYANEGHRIRVRLRSPSGQPLTRIWVKVRGRGTGDAARTNRQGEAILRVHPHTAGLLAVRASRATSCRLQVGATDRADGSQLTG